MIVCRAAICEDAQLLAQVRQTVWKETYRGIYPDEMLDDADLQQARQRFYRQIGNPAHHVYLYFDGSVCVGYFAFGPSNYGAYKDFALCLNNLYIRKEYKGRGLGREAFACIRKYCAEQGISKFFCGCNLHNTAAAAFYSHMGGIRGDAAVIHENKYDDIIHFEFYTGEEI